MDTILYLIFTLAYFILFGFGFFLIRRNTSIPGIILLLVTLGLIIDNAIIASGSLIGEGGLLKSVSMIRFWTHALFTPALALFGWHMAYSFGVKWAESRLSHHFALVLTLLLMIIEIVTETLSLNLTPVYEYGVLRYSSAHSSGPPIMVLVLIVYLLAASFSIWRKTKWPIILNGVVIMLIGSAVSLPIPSSAATNAFELIFILSLWITYRKSLKAAG
ncbi:hypothetical protein [Metabacillus hrfriensis]|uniref:Uncharacterized protein n=1 Tax=Metabacillus hrfriensis TaxID=3048891 RepID=A0ACD4R5T0_9BACI|nr:hypothetical protein [Metabacillus sp. CT-WN-B3]USK26592.1 hypothetical protein LIT32_13820 [Bacillus sp. CMF21]WHZ55815.1 hypothetical protein QLQ22_13900 [Metabacillus sp. CT-WN-B3]